MRKMIAVVDANPGEGLELCRILERSRYLAASMGSLTELLDYVRQEPCQAVILDLDSLPVDNRFIRTLCKENPGLRLIGISNRTFHPELEEAMRTHISACLSKPLDPDELIYWIRSLCGGEPRSRASPEGRRH